MIDRWSSCLYDEINIIDNGKMDGYEAAAIARGSEMTTVSQDSPDASGAATMSDRSRRKLVEFLDWLGGKGLMPSNTVSARKAVVNQVLGILSDEEAEDVLSIDLDELMAKFHNKNRSKYTPESLTTYRSRLQSTLKDFESYLNNPLGFRPKNLRIKISPKTTKEVSKEGGGEPNQQASKARYSGNLEEPSIIPIPIREDLVVRIQGIPFNLTRAEAQRIANVIMALANSD